MKDKLTFAEGKLIVFLRKTYAHKELHLHRQSRFLHKFYAEAYETVGVNEMLRISPVKNVYAFYMKYHTAQAHVDEK